MGKTINFFRGSVTLDITAPFPERVLNLCAQHGVLFWGVAWLEGGVLRLTVPRRQASELRRLVEGIGGRAEEKGRRGLPDFLLGFKRRYALWVGLALSVLAVTVLSQFVLVVEVTGNERLSTAELRTALARYGVGVGAFGLTLDTAKAEQQMLVEMEELSWIGINLYGIRAQVQVRERTAPPEVVDRTVTGDIVAEAPGVVTNLSVYAGDRKCAEGQPVAEGDVLISGSVLLEGPLYSEQDVGWMEVRAQGVIEADTWRTLTASIPLTAQVKRCTGETEWRLFAEVLGRRVDFFGKSGIYAEQYDKISETWTAALPDGTALPLTVGRQILRAYTLEEVPVDVEQADAMVRDQLLRRLEGLLGEDGTVLSTEYTSVVGENTLTVTLRAACHEEIGRFVPYETNK